MAGEIRVGPSFEGSSGTLLLLCPICGSDDAEPVGVIGDFDHGPSPTLSLRCGNCNGVYLNPPPEISRSSSSAFPDEDLMDLRFQGFGGAVVIVTEVEALAALEPVSTSVIFAPFVLERVSDPKQLLQQLHRALKPGGKVLLAASNTEGWSFRLFGGRSWSEYEFPVNRQLFDKRSIAWLANSTNFIVRGYKTIPRSRTWVTSSRATMRDWGFPDSAVTALAGDWFGPSSIASLIEQMAVWVGRGTIITTQLEVP